MNIHFGMDNFDCTKMNAHFEKFTAYLREGLIHEWKQALLAHARHTHSDTCCKTQVQRKYSVVHRERERKTKKEEISSNH